MQSWQGAFLCFVELIFFQFYHPLCAIVETVKEGFILVSRAEAAAEMECGIVVIQRQMPQEIVQFFEAFPDVRGIGFVGFCVYPV